jgi:hypothetical protein
MTPATVPINRLPHYFVIASHSLQLLTEYSPLLDTSSANHLRSTPISIPDNLLDCLFQIDQFTMAAIIAIRTDNELKTYYQKKIKEGKPKMCIINIIRNKLVARAFAVVKRGTSFVVLHQHVA